MLSNTRCLRLFAIGLALFGPASASAQQVYDFAYDDLGRLLSVSNAHNQSWQYDALGNITSNSRFGSYSYDDPSHVHAVTRTQLGQTTTDYSYDANGNLTQGGGRSYVWDIENRIQSVTVDGSTTTMAYDGEGQRIKKSSTAGGTVLYFSNLLEKDGATLIKYIYVGKRRLARREGTGAKHFFHTDHLGSTRLVTDGTGAVTKRYDYWPFGEVSSQSGTLTNNELKFTGHYQDDETRVGSSENGLIYMKARYYDPELGRFLTADSMVPYLEDPQSYNRYSYTRNNPLVRVDATGHADTWSTSTRSATTTTTATTKATPPQPGGRGRAATEGEAEGSGVVGFDNLKRVKRGGEVTKNADGSATYTLRGGKGTKERAEATHNELFGAEVNYRFNASFTVPKHNKLNQMRTNRQDSTWAVLAQAKLRRSGESPAWALRVGNDRQLRLTVNNDKGRQTVMSVPFVPGQRYDVSLQVSMHPDSRGSILASINGQTESYQGQLGYAAESTHGSLVKIGVYNSGGNILPLGGGLRATFHSASIQQSSPDASYLQSSDGR